MSIILGPKLIGKEAAAKAQAAFVDESGGGAIQLGTKLLEGNEKFAKRRAEALASLPVSHPSSTAPVELAPVPAPRPRATGNKVPKPKAEIAKAPVPMGAPQASYSEQDIEVMLATDPNQWDLVCQTESERPDGWRPAVATMVLNAAPDAKDKPIPAPVVAELKRVVEKSQADDVAALKSAADNAPAAQPPSATHEAYDKGLRAERV